MDDDKYFDTTGSLQDVMPHPGDIEEYELVGVYVRAYQEYIRTTTKNTALFEQTLPDLDQTRRAASLVLPYESRLERWLDNAREYLPDWFEDFD